MRVAKFFDDSSARVPAPRDVPRGISRILELAMRAIARSQWRERREQSCEAFAYDFSLFH